MTLQYIRTCTLIVEGGDGSFNLSNMRIRFKVTHWETLTPRNAEIVVYNLAPATEQKIIKGEYKRVTLSAGYNGNEGIVFKGEIIQKRNYRENPVDTCLAIIAVDQQQAYTYGTINKTLPAGSTYKDQVDELLKAWKPFGVEAGYIADLGNKKMPRARVLFGQVKDKLREIGFATGTSPTIQYGKLHMIKNDGFMPGSTFVLNSNTGMIGRPEQTIDGIIVRMLLNPAVRPGTRLQINEGSINKAAYSPSNLGALNNEQLASGPASIAADGIYKVIDVDEEGDTRGPPWYTTAICMNASEKGLPLGAAQRGMTEPT